jgi:TBC1 domain family protein 5
VERTFPDIPYFRIEKVRTALTTALFMFSVMNPDVGYRQVSFLFVAYSAGAWKMRSGADGQGMHELLAVCLLVVDRDSLESTSPDRHADPLSPGSSNSAAVESAMLVALDRRYVEHDAFALFQEIMRGAKAFYEWRGEEGPVCLAGQSASVLPNRTYTIDVPTCDVGS